MYVMLHNFKHIIHEILDSQMTLSTITALDKSTRREVEFVMTQNGQQVENTYPDLVMSYRQQQREYQIKKEEERKLRKLSMLSRDKDNWR